MSTDSTTKFFDICAAHDKTYRGPEAAINAWKTGSRFLCINGGVVRRTDGLFKRLKEEGYTGVRLYLGYRFHFVENIE